MSAVTKAAQDLPSGEKRGISIKKFDWIMTALSAWLIVGIFLDGWAHIHGKVDESFFTPWHGILYSGLLALGLFLAYSLYQHYQPNIHWSKWLPSAYTLSVVGVLIFALGGIADLIWHMLFGIELGVDATISPSHLLLAVGGILIVTGPLRSAWKQEEQALTLGDSLPMLLSLAFAISLLSFFTLYAHPLVDAWATMRTVIDHELNLSSEFDVFMGQAAGVTSIILQSAILMATVFIAMRQAKLPFGSFALMFTLNAALMSVLHDRYNSIPVLALAGLVADSLYIWLKPAVERFNALLLFAFLVPAIYYALYFFLLAFTEQLWWSFSMLAGSIVLAGLTGLLLAYPISSLSSKISGDASPSSEVRVMGKDPA
jgi:hypothetical protein